MEGTWRLPSPGFITRPPVIRNAGLLTAAARLPMQPAWDARQHDPREVVLHDLRDVFLAGEGLVFGRDLAVFPPSVTQHTPAEVEAGRQRLVVALAAGSLAQHPGQTVLCVKRGAGNYGHWLAEMLPVAFLCLGALQSGRLFALAPAPGGPLGAVPADSLDLLGVPSDQVRGLDGAPQWFARLLVPEGLTWHGHHISPLVVQALARMAERVPAGPACQVWVSRTGTHRTLYREAELCAMLAGMGWTVLHPGELSLLRQISLFKGARHVAGVCGAGLTNLVFAPAPARITGFVPAGMYDTFYWMLSELCGHDYVDVRCQQGGSVTGPSPWDAALVVSLPAVLQHLA